MRSQPARVQFTESRGSVPRVIVVGKQRQNSERSTTNERRKERRKEGRKEGRKEQRKEGRKERRKEGRNERTKERRNKGTKERRNDGSKGTKGRQRTSNERTNKRTKAANFDDDDDDEQRTKNERTNERMNSEQQRNDTMTLPNNRGYAINFNFPSASAPTLKFQFSALLRRLKIAKMEKSEKSECASLRRSATPRTLTHSVSQVNRSFYEHGSYSKVVFHKDKGTPPTATDYI